MVTPRVDHSGGTLGPVGAPSNTELSTATLLQLIFEAHDDAKGGDPLAHLDLSQITGQQAKDLQEALSRRGEALTREEKEAFEKGDTDHLRALLQRLRAKTLAQTQTATLRQAQQRDAIGPQTASPRGHAPAEHLPAAGATSTSELLHLVYQATGGDPFQGLNLAVLSRGQLQELEGALLKKGEALSLLDKEALAEGKPEKLRQLLKRLYEKSLRERQQGRGHHPGESFRKPLGFDLLKARGPVTDPKILDETKRQLLKLICESQAGKSIERALSGKRLGHNTAVLQYRNGFPSAGRSGEAHQMPLLQFMAPGLLKTADRLGVHTLVDFLACGMLPESRLLLAQTLGMPAPALLLAMYRAELLDLPIQNQRGKHPHLKDVLLLSRLGAGSVGSLGHLARIFEEQPSHLEALADAMAKLQRGVPSWVGRQRITRHDLREWALAAERRGSDIVLAARAEHEDSAAQVAAEGVLGGYLQGRRRNTEDAWHDLVLRLLWLMRQHDIETDEELLQRLAWGDDQERLAQYREVAWRRADELEGQRLAIELQRYHEYIVQEEATSVFLGLEPWSRPDVNRQDRLVCFWIEPAPEQRLASGGVPESLRPVYVCMDVESGAIAPFGAEIG